MKTYSAGFIKEATVLVLMRTLMELDSDSRVEVPLQDADSLITKLLEEIEDYILMLPIEVRSKVFKRGSNVFNRLLTAIPHRLAPELLALYVLHINFNERLGRPLDRELEVFQRDYMSAAEAICGTAIGELEAVMFKTSYEILAVIKG